MKLNEMAKDEKAMNAILDVLIKGGVKHSLKG